MFEYTEEQLKCWKDKYGDDGVFELMVEDKKAVLHKPSRKDLSFASAGSAYGSDVIKFTEILMRQCWIDGDIEIKEDDNYFLGAVPVVQAIAEAKQAELKKL